MRMTLELTSGNGSSLGIYPELLQTEVGAKNRGFTRWVGGASPWRCIPLGTRILLSVGIAGTKPTQALENQENFSAPWILTSRRRCPGKLTWVLQVCSSCVGGGCDGTLRKLEIRFHLVWWCDPLCLLKTY